MTTRTWSIPDYIHKTYQTLCSHCTIVRFHNLHATGGRRCIRLTIGDHKKPESFIGDYFAVIGTAVSDHAMAHFLTDPRCRERLEAKLGPAALAEVDAAFALDQAAMAEL